MGPVRSDQRNTLSIDCSILIPVFNALDYTRECIETLLRDGSDVAFEIIVVDNGSTDDTPSYLRSKRDSLTVVSPGMNLGFARANNLAARHAIGRFLVLLNNDTIPEQGWLEAMVQATESDKNVGIVGAKLLYPLDRLVQHAGVVLTDDLKLMHIYERFPEDHPAVNKRREFRIVTAACMLVKRELYSELNGLDERFVNGFEDVDFCLRAGEKGMRVIYEPKAVVLHHAERTSGRHLHETNNAMLLTKLWRHKLTPNINRYLTEDGYKINHNRGVATIAPQGERMIELSDSVSLSLQDKARETLKDGKIGEALDLYEQLYRIDPNNRFALSYIADIHERRGDLEKAATALLKLLRTHPAAEVCLRLAQNALKQQHYDDAIGFAQDSMNNFGDNGQVEDARTIIADTNYKSGAADTAAELYDAILTANSHNVRALTGRGTVALTRKEYRDAIEYFDRALEVNPHHSRAILGKGLAYMGLNRQREAANLISESLTMEGDNGWAIATILPILSETGKLDIADKALKGYLDFYPDDYPMLLARAGISFAMGRYDLSRKLLDTVLETHPEYPGTEDLDRELKLATEMTTSQVAVPVPA
ncbi:glycosyltransferase [bacterium]|nr:glycosyltransferase [bacterium]